MNNRRPSTRFAVVMLLIAMGLPASEAEGQDATRTVVADEQYAAGGLHRFIFGGDYRALWTLPIQVEVLDLQTFGGGLTATTAGGGFQTLSLRFRGADGLEYGFRSINKEPGILPDGLAGTFVEDLVQDQISSAFPSGPAVASVLKEGAGILHTTPRLVMLPDDPALGEHRERFAGSVGYIAARAITGPGLEPFAGAAEIIDGDEMFARAQRGPADRVDSRAFLAARMVDMLIGDWDRHRGQWGWARFGDEPVTRWIPIPEDRDQAFVRFDGLFLSLARITTPQLTLFSEEYGSIHGLTWNGRELDRRFLVDLEKPVWDSVAAELKFRITDSVIDLAVQAMPREYQRVEGPRLSRTLKRRRDRLEDAADRFYRLLTREVDIHATDGAEVVVVDRRADNTTLITIARGAQEPYFRRVFDPNETTEIRIFLHGGDDRVDVRGSGRKIPVRVVGGTGSDRVWNSSPTGGVHFYTADGDQVSGPESTKVDRRPFVLPPKKRPTELPPRDWGSRWRALPWAGFAPDVGFFIGGGFHRTDFGFRHLPYASKVRLRGGFAAGATTGLGELSIELQRANSRVRGEIDLRVSGIEVLKFHGFGNEALLTGPNDGSFYRVNQVEVSFEPSLVLPLGVPGELAIGPVFTYYDTKDQPGRFLATLPGLYGTGEFGQVGGRVDIRVDTRDVPAAATRGVWFNVGSSIYPELWDVVSTYGEVHGEVAAYLSATRAPLRPTLALRGGGKKVWGSVFPFQQSAFIGDARTVRLGRQNRYAGEASAYGNAELRLDLGARGFILPGRIGIHGVADVGRVWLDGESSDRWHAALGGGMWISFLTQANVLSVTVTQSEVGSTIPGRIGVYVQAGFAY